MHEFIEFDSKHHDKKNDNKNISFMIEIYFINMNISWYTTVRHDEKKMCMIMAQQFFLGELCMQFMLDKFC